MQTESTSLPERARLLIVDDEEAQMRALCQTLGSRGYQTSGFTNGAEALAALEKQPFDLLLSDLTMPKMDGIALLQSAFKIDANLVGIIMTGQGTIHTAVEAMKSGALDYILKPFNLSFILPVLSRALALRRLRLENAQLNRKIQERTQELEIVNQELEAFSYSVSHDLRAPVRSIHGFSSILMKRYGEGLPSEAQRLLNNVTSSAQLMALLIDGLLNLSRLGRQALLKQTVDVSALVDEVLEEQLREAGGRAIEVRKEGLGTGFADRALLRQVFVNLLSNAFKFTRHREKASIEISCRPLGAEQVYCVADNGAGFDMQYAGKLFGVFQRMHQADQFEGTGIGLSIVQRIVQRHNGRVWAESQEDRGAKFYFSLPCS